jgi:triosephosphate isomerase
MRKKVIAGNWKMNMDLNGSIELISGLKNSLKEIDINCNVIVCPPYTSLETAKELIKESKIQLGAQNMY